MSASETQQTDEFSIINDIGDKHIQFLRENMLPRIIVDFLLTGISVSPDEITKRIGIIPTKTWLLGDSNQGTKLQRKHNGWCLSASGLEESIDLEEQLGSILEIVLSRSEIINQICNEFELVSEFSCAIYVRDETPIVNFSKETISALAKLNAALDIDIIIT